MPAPDPRPVMILAGGTGGHVFPGLAVAEVFSERGVPVVWLGGEQGIETRVVPAAGIELEQIEVRALRGKGLLRWLGAPLMITAAIWQAAKILRRRKPQAVLAFGGFAAGPGGLAAKLLGQRLVIHEQNARPGLTNRVLSRLATVTLSGFPQAIAGSRHVGNPVRAAIQAGSPRQLGRRLLVLGGSQGAQALNQVMPVAIAAMQGSDRPDVLHQTGEADEKSVRRAYRDHDIDAKVSAFIDDMPAAYLWADIVVCRAGALTLAELAIAGLGAILVPLPHAVDDHQTANARHYAEHGAAILMPQSELTEASLSTLLQELFGAPERLAAMGQANRELAMPDASRRVADVCLGVAA